MTMTGINGINKSKKITPHSILLVDCFTPIDDIQNIVKRIPKILVISFDYDSHLFLNHN